MPASTFWDLGQRSDAYLPRSAESSLGSRGLNCRTTGVPESRRQRTVPISRSTNTTSSPNTIFDMEKPAASRTDKSRITNAGSRDRYEPSLHESSLRATFSQFIYSLRFITPCASCIAGAMLGTSQPLSEITYACGLNDYTHFARKFRHRFLVRRPRRRYTPVPVKVRRRLTTFDRPQVKIESKLGSCLDRLPLEEKELWKCCG
jgi:AraC-like DNA-binding protein